VSAVGVVSAPAFAPATWLGGESPFGLVLPDASPTPSTMYAPRGVCLTPTSVIAADTGNHRLVVWHDPMPDPHSDAHVVIGQPDMTSEGPKLFFLPTGLLVLPDGRLVVCDAWHHRLLVWDQVPERGDEAPSMVLGQPDGLDGVGEGVGPQRFYWPFGAALVDGTFWVADTGNRRVLGWYGGLPDPGRPADVVLGQPDLWSRGENRDGPVSAGSLRWPHAIASVGDLLLVADAGNHRVLGYRDPASGDDAAVVIGQPGFTTAVEFPYRPQGTRAFRFPYGLTATSDGRLFVADTSNNRVAVLDDAAATFATDSVGGSFDRVLGQLDTDANGENRWDRVALDSLCWPYGLASCGDRLAVADSGNNRVTIWRAEPLCDVSTDGAT
jgi:DNA-binding beta-propeller fold protein YncE